MGSRGSLRGGENFLVKTLHSFREKPLKALWGKAARGSNEKMMVSAILLPSAKNGAVACDNEKPR
jgi:hypothetical protein